jgi:hypothetical protein
MRNTIISKFKNFKDVNPEEVILWDYLHDFTYKNDVENIRKIESKAERSRLKSQLPAITPSGNFSKRKTSGLINHSGFICIDIDSGDNPEIIDFEKLRDDLTKISNVAFASISVSGNGVFAIIPIQFPDKHKQHFEALKKCFEKLGIILDKACGDITRLRCYSYDENAYFNENAVVFEQFFEYKSEVIPKRISSNIKGNQNNGNTTHNKVISVVTRLNNSSIDITETYEHWFQIACAFANEFGEEGRDIFHLVSQNSPKYHSGECDRLFTNCIAAGYSYGIGTFFRLVQQSGNV